MIFNIHRRGPRVPNSDQEGPDWWKAQGSIVKVAADSPYPNASQSKAAANWRLAGNKGMF